MIRSAACTCGQVTAEVEGEPIRISMCHCHNCQRRTGSVFSAQARWPREAVTIRGERSTYVLTGDSGGRATFEFCPRCGATICWIADAQPDVVYLPIGAFADNTFPPPRVSVYEDRRHPWVSIPDGAERLD